MVPTPDTAKGLKIGLLGGSFNPAHQGHLDLTSAARRIIGLDQVWWLVTPQNPLKEAKDYAPLPERLAGARAVAGGRPWLRVTDIEDKMGTRYTVDTLKELTKRFTQSHFVWLMGADSLASFHRWRQWEQILSTMPVAVISRPGHDLAALKSPAARAYAGYRMRPDAVALLPLSAAPAWAFLPIAHNPISSTALRTSKQTL
ncbi:nicotinate-nucleotide adenylyltransferase [Parvularcula sp. LCG005]|uniref:nicotinate-nucleotide adenylyltransferase n=1 Tax=Parvularcula sp. LCG005 TaxID=3078805 RepID=UPI00294267B1|nr:nicotinate-nucleotide adenylyltransferase [Parvularcula sp. LCG005]WOI53090.1 nicotinate-nucleotide adenylyltransferase [Parvularcula sp. LCG005]